ncbi:MAG TPA: tRNA preQ1(34) S-adenosylmethionine ribosyltransferase-isomerase QueA [Candidatus Binataceae bacterium]|nr:tRNA preQ1(34) S-adenosylmethionine ribosyltransferase-isomerase QueA [Candidatus Binataceae bacterium]
MRLSELDYDLPPELIAQHPLAERDQARMLVVNRRAKTLEHSRFYKLAENLREGDLVVLNETRVLPARLYARKESGGRVELLMVRPVEESNGGENPSGGWIALARAHRGLTAGTRLMLEGGRALRVAAISREHRPIVVTEDGSSIEELLAVQGRLALPHYIRREAGADDLDDYQTVYARTPGAIAAPTAGLHFTDRVFADLAAAGIRTARVTLHIGPGTFAPVRTDALEGHTMEAEWFTIPPAARDAFEHTRRIGGRIVAVGTSSVRALESWAITGDAEGFSGLFIYPGFRFKMVDAMITNFHMPRTTVLALVMALAGRETILDAYAEAIRRRYRFLSYGDAMLIQ